MTGRQRGVLERIVRRATSPQRLVRRARAVLAAADGRANAAIGRQVGMSRDRVRLWRQRWGERAEALLAAELEGDDRALEAVLVGVLADECRPGAPRVPSGRFTPEQVCQIMALACEPPAASGRPVSHWTAREIADEAVQRELVPSISAASVGRFLKCGGTPAAPQPVLAHART